MLQNQVLKHFLHNVFKTIMTNLMKIRQLFHVKHIWNKNDNIHKNEVQDNTRSDEYWQI